ncbi:helix-turn-helix domain-containing protein [Nocardia suismassiliense]|uniref:helix-turn-helix domain-containing protein n=1 Tax=Nocardia suismassiliense TaxID=2077092 RepID=UPI000D1D99EA|nr:helix-turn-helix transcriptional regulator [Nocardia suismassiliense]
MAESVENNDSTVARRQLGRHLRKLREDAGMTREQSAPELEISVSTLIRIETGKTGLKTSDVDTMCRLYKQPEMADALKAYARAAKTKSWYRQYKDVIPEWFDVYIGLEQIAAKFRWHEGILVPGILQTKDYAATVIRAHNPDVSDDEIDRRVQLRLQRQAVLTRPVSPPEWHIVLNEAVLRRQIGGPLVMHEQLDRLLEVTALPNVTLGIIPLDADVDYGVLSGPFLILDFPTNGNGQSTEPTTVYVEGFIGALYTDDEEEVNRYRTAFTGISSAALSPGDSKASIAKVAKEMKRK